jgi:hypothetical protein
MKNILEMTLFYTIACLVALLEILVACTIVLIPLLLSLRFWYDLFRHPFQKMVSVCVTHCLRR